MFLIFTFVFSSFIICKIILQIGIYSFGMIPLNPGTSYLMLNFLEASITISCTMQYAL